MALFSLRRTASPSRWLRSLVPTACFSSQRELRIIESVADFHAARRSLSAGATVGLVPTMGVRYHL